jgi:hypothetical protein
MNDGSQDAGAGVNLVWTNINGTNQTLGRRKAGIDTALAVINGPTHVSVAADLDTQTYSVAINGSVVGAGIAFDANGPLDMLRFLTDNLNEANFSGRTIDNVIITSTSTGGNTAPTITSLDTASVDENQTTAIDVAATDDTDGEGAGLTYTLTAGADQALFSVDAASGLVTFNAAPDFESPGDAGADNVYDVQVTVTDSGSLTDVQDIAVTVTDVAVETGTELLNDSFDRADSATVDGWTEVEATGATVAVAGFDATGDGELFFATDPNTDTFRPLVRRSFEPVSTGTLQWDFDFDWARPGSPADTDSEVWMQLGKGSLMVDPTNNVNRFTGVGVRLRWGLRDGTQQMLTAASTTGGITDMQVISGPTTISVTADVGAKTYSVTINGTLAASGLIMDNLATVDFLDTVRFYTTKLDDAAISGRAFDNVIISTP